MNPWPGHPLSWQVLPEFSNANAGMVPELALDQFPFHIHYPIPVFTGLSFQAVHVDTLTASLNNPQIHCGTSTLLTFKFDSYRASNVATEESDDSVL